MCVDAINEKCGLSGHTAVMMRKNSDSSLGTISHNIGS